MTCSHRLTMWRHSVCWSVDKKQAVANRMSLEKKELIKRVGSVSPEKEAELRKKADKVLWTKKNENSFIVDILKDMGDGADISVYAKYKNITFIKIA